MNRLRKVVNNTLISLVGQAITWSSTLVLTIAYGRFLTDVKFGELYFAITFVALIGFPIEFGLNQQIVRDVSQQPELARRYFSNTFLIKFMLWAIFFSAILAICHLLAYPSEVQTLVFICGLMLLCTGTTNIFSSFHFASERNIYPVLGTVLEKGLDAAIGFLLLRHGYGVVTIGLVLLGAAFINTLWQGAWFFRFVKVSLDINVPLIRTMLRTSVPFLIYGVLGVIYYRLDTILLSLMTNDAAIGLYGAGYRLFDTLTFLPSIVVSAIMYPVFSKLSLNSKEDLKKSAEKATNFLLFCVAPISTLLIIAAPAIIGYLYHHSDYVGTIPVLIALSPGLFFLYLNSVLSAIIMSTKLEKKMPIMAGAALIFNLVLNLLFIPMFQQVAAAAITSLTELLLLILSLFFIPRYLIPTRSVLVGLKCIAASVIMGGVIWLLRYDSLLIILGAAAVVYLVAATLLRTIPKEDIQAIYWSIRHKVQAAEPILETNENQPYSLLMASISDEDTIILPAIDSRTRSLFATYIDDEDDEDTLPKYPVTKPVVLPVTPHAEAIEAAYYDPIETAQ